MSVNEINRQTAEVFIQCLAMPAIKNAPLAFRVPAELKRELQQIADREARSISQICEILLRIGTEQYAREGSKFLRRFLDRRRTDG
jgi:hypothetical protein